MTAIRRFKPLLALIAWPCTEWSLFNENCNYSRRLQELNLKIDVKNNDDWWSSDVTLPKSNSTENPIRSRIWNEPRVEELRQCPDVFTVENEAGAYGAETADGEPMRKGHR